MDRKTLDQKSQREKWEKWQRQALDYVPTAQESNEKIKEKQSTQMMTKEEIEAMIQQEAERIASNHILKRTPVYHHNQYDQVINRIKSASRQTGNWQTF